MTPQLPVRQALATAKHWCILRAQDIHATRFGALFGDEATPSEEHIYSIADLTALDARLVDAALHSASMMLTNVYGKGFDFMLDYWHKPFLLIPPEAVIALRDQPVEVYRLKGITGCDDRDSGEALLHFEQYTTDVTRTGVTYAYATSQSMFMVKTAWLEETFPGYDARLKIAEGLSLSTFDTIEYILPTAGTPATLPDQFGAIDLLSAQ